MVTTEDWRDFFPLPEIRPEQDKAISYILNRLEEEDTQNILVEGPVGVGKSAIAYTVARYKSVENGWRTRIMAPNIFLENQYLGDFAHLGLLQLHSARHYTCPGHWTCEIGRGSEIIYGPVDEDTTPEGDGTGSGAPDAPIATVKPKQKVKPVRVMFKPKCRDEACPYLDARTEFETAAIGITNTAFALTCARYRHSFVRSDLSVFDEGHKLADAIAEMYEVVIDLSRSGLQSITGNPFKWVTTVYRINLANQINATQENIENARGLLKNKKEALKLQRRLAQLSLEADNIDRLAQCNQSDWIVKTQPWRITFQPLWAKHEAPRLLNFLSPRRILMSGTFLDFRQHLDWLGLSAP